MPVVIAVALPIPIEPLDYLLPVAPPPAHGGATPAARAPLPVGARVAVPWQGGVRVGWVVDAHEAPAAAALDLRPAVAWVDAGAHLTAPALALLRAQAERCAVPFGVALAGMHPHGAMGDWKHELQAAVPLPHPELPAQLAGWCDASDVDAASLELWRSHALIHERVFEPPRSERRLVPLREGDSALDGAKKANQRRALACLHRLGGCDSVAALAREADVPATAVRALVTHGYAGYADQPRPPAAMPWVKPFGSPPPTVPAPIALPAGTADTRVATLVAGGGAQARLQHLRTWLAQRLHAGGSALVLVPEQAAIDTLAAELANQFPTLRWLSSMPAEARERVHAGLLSGERAVVVGTYPALLLPMLPLAAVAVWDAGAHALKQVGGARSVLWRDALTLAEAAGAPCLLLDALGTVELRAAVTQVEALPRPPMRGAIIDMRSERGWPLSAPLLRLLKQVVERARQAVLVVPRRGYAAALACRECGSACECPNCDLPLRWHAASRRLRCHHCGHSEGAPRACAVCGGVDVAPRAGAGTEWVMEVAAEALGDFPIYRVDRDRRDDPAPLYAGEPGLVVGTWAALRLPPLPNLALVALTGGDNLHDHEDVRAEEASLRTLLQLPDLAAGGKRPLLVAQVYRPEHAVWQAWTATELDPAVAAFLHGVQERRERLGYPPARAWARVQLSHRDPTRTMAAAQALAERLRLVGADVLGPAPAPIPRVRGRHLVHVIVRADTAARLSDHLRHVDARPGAGVVARVDVDPYDLESVLDA